MNILELVVGQHQLALVAPIAVVSELPTMELRIVELAEVVDVGLEVGDVEGWEEVGGVFLAF